MSNLITLLTHTPPSIAGYTMDAVLEDDLEFSKTITEYPTERGVSIADHHIINPIQYKMTCAISNKELKTNLTDFAGGLVSNLTDNPLVASVAGMSAGFLASSEETRASSALIEFVKMLEGEKAFDVDAGDVQLKNMVFTNIRRKKDPENEDALIVELTLKEFITVDRLSQDGQPHHDQLRKGSKEQSANARQASKGNVNTKPV